MRYLNQIEGILSIVNEKNETVWYVRGKTLNGEKRGQIFRAKNPRTDFDLSSNPHGNARNTCTQYNGSGKGNANNNNFRNARYVPSSNNDDNNTNGKVNRNPNAFDVDINGNYDPRKQLVFPIECSVLSRLLLVIFIFFLSVYSLLSFYFISIVLKLAYQFVAQLSV